FITRDLVAPPEMIGSDGRQMHMGPHLGPPLPPHANVISGLRPSAGYGFLPSEPMETVARRQELIHKQNIARMEMNAILHQKELENAHQKGLMGIENPMPYPSNPMAFRGRQRVPEGHEVFVHRPTLDELHSNSILMSASPYPPISTLHRERGRRAGRRPATHKSAESHAAALKGQSEDKNVGESPGAASGEEKEAESKVDLGEKFIYPPAGGAVPGMPYMFPLPANGFFPPGPSNLFLNGDHVSEDVRKWTVNDVYSFISSIPTCSEYAQTFKDHMIDGETLPLLSEEHLLDTLGLKLGPALKIRSQVSRRLGNMFYMMNLPLSAATLQAAPGKPGDG
uniref:Sterile alpha motif domain containing 7 n=1 Tax=Tetraodon nigroviridis TaxID=99883 RepID=H3CTX8_TETNG